MNWRIEFAPEVERDVAEAAHWYEIRQPGLGLRFVEEIITAWDSLSENPLPGCRRYPTKTFIGATPSISRIGLFTRLMNPSNSSGWRRFCTLPVMIATGNNGFDKASIVKFLPALLAFGLCVLPTWAHDPYEITSVAYIHSNRIELFVEMEFPTGMTLAGRKPVSDVAVLTQFESALPRLREMAGSFFDLTAGNNVVLPLSTNVELGVEDHIRFQVEFKPTPYRPLRFVRAGFGGRIKRESLWHFVDSAGHGES